MKRSLDEMLEIFLEEYLVWGEEGNHEEGEEENFKEEISSKKEGTVFVSELFGLRNKDNAGAVFEQNSILDTILNEESFFLDVFCRMRRNELNNTTKLRNVKSRMRNCSPNQLHNKGLIRGGNFSGWKAVIPDGLFAEAICIRQREFELRGIDSVLNHTITALIVVNHAINVNRIAKKNGYQKAEIYEPEEEDGIWIIADKIMQAYEKEEMQSNLSNLEKGIIIRALLDSGSLFFQRSGVSILGESLYPKNNENVEEIKKRLSRSMRSLKKKGIIGRKVKIENSKNNISENTVQFKPFLAPIIAGICESYGKNPFLVKKAMWSRQISINELCIPGMDSATERTLSRDCGVLLHYGEYVDSVGNMARDLQYYEYEALFNILLYKIREFRDIIHPNQNIMQYYLLEELMGFQFVQEVATHLYSYTDMLAEHYPAYLSKSMPCLAWLLGSVYLYFGVFARIEVAKFAIDKYFQLAKSEITERHFRNAVRELGKHIERYSNAYYERISTKINDLTVMSVDKESHINREAMEVEFMRHASVCERAGIRKEQRGDVKSIRMEQYVGKRLGEYEKRMDELVEKENQRSTSRDHLGVASIAKKTKDDILASDDKMIPLKQMIVREIFLAGYSPQFCILED